MDQVLGNKGLEAGEVIEQEYVAMLHRFAIDFGILVQLDIKLEQLFGSAEGPDTEIVNPVIDLRIFGGRGHLPFSPAEVYGGSHIAEVPAVPGSFMAAASGSEIIRFVALAPLDVTTDTWNLLTADIVTAEHGLDSGA